jgi:hypothetical protein
MLRTNKPNQGGRPANEFGPCHFPSDAISSCTRWETLVTRNWIARILGATDNFLIKVHPALFSANTPHPKKRVAFLIPNTN